MNADDRVRGPLTSRRLLLGMASAGALGLAACASEKSTSGAASTTATPSSPSSAKSPAKSSPTASPTSSPTGPPLAARTTGPDLTAAHTGRAEVALTFHGAGEASIADAILRILKERDALMSVFAVGVWVEKDPSIVQRIKGAGHEVGNHTYNHLDMLTLGQAQAEDEIRRGKEVLTKALGSAGWWFRPSGTEHSNEIIRAAAAAQGYPVCVSYNVDPQDFREPGATVVRERTKAAVAAGSLVSLHLGHQGTVEALPGILDDLAAKNLQPVTLSALLRP